MNFAVLIGKRLHTSFIIDWTSEKHCCLHMRYLLMKYRFLCVFLFQSLIPRFPCEMPLCIFFLSPLHWFLPYITALLIMHLSWAAPRVECGPRHFGKLMGRHSEHTGTWELWLAGENGKELVPKMNKLHFVDLANPFFLFSVNTRQYRCLLYYVTVSDASCEYWTI